MGTNNDAKMLHGMFLDGQFRHWQIEEKSGVITVEVAPQADPRNVVVGSGPDLITASADVLRQLAALGIHPSRQPDN